jgi:riboflavin kinase/FMN adenylyltransferase
MHVVSRLSDLIPRSASFSLGCFDGVHLGHQALLRAATPPLTLLTWTTHPADLLHPGHHTPLICSVEERLELLASCSVAQVVALPFTHALARTPFDTFLKDMRAAIGFSHLLLGHGATLGADRLGTEERIRPLAEAEGFTVQYLDKTVLEGVTISSSHIRSLIQQGDLKTVSRCLGRPYSLKGLLRGNLCTLPPCLCLPPAGHYQVQVQGIEAEATVDPKQGTLRLDGVALNDAEIVIVTFLHN